MNQHANHNREIHEEKGMGGEKVAILGTGRVGQAIGKRLVLAGRSVLFGSRDPSSSRAKFASLGLESTFSDCQIESHRDAIEVAPIVLLAVPWSKAEAIAESIDDWNGKTLIDCSNPLNATFDALQFGFDTSAAEKIALKAKGAHVVKALNTASTLLMNDPTIHGEPIALLYCGDHLESKGKAKALIADVGFSPVDVGPLQAARNLEAFAMLCIDMAVRRGFGPKLAFKLLH